jgi:hypothetical protein
VAVIVAWSHRLAAWNAGLLRESRVSLDRKVVVATAMRSLVDAPHAHHGHPIDGAGAAAARSCWMMFVSGRRTVSAGKLSQKLELAGPTVTRNRVWPPSV